MPRNAEKFTEWSTGSSGAHNANGKKHARDLEKVLELSFWCPMRFLKDLKFMSGGSVSRLRKSLCTYLKRPHLEKVKGN